MGVVVLAVARACKRHKRPCWQCFSIGEDSGGSISGGAVIASQPSHLAALSLTASACAAAASTATAAAAGALFAAAAAYAAAAAATPQ
eukprot:361730-Chlamydomonas_euryale.AAC.2